MGRPEFYAGFNSREATPTWTKHVWAAMEFQTIEQAEACVRQLKLVGESCRVVE
jgi:hypothetical protein